ncbi:serine/threonine-protein kinase fhke-related [Anaeramoeba ignava]|uniref:Serine/threonine-protein kinase fhke-related n=1 Tax=Anaeramoeba ignava TaxID=1746090 RepID=A0A9Q0LH29_ANAIG|nr:serine/threonine-protein kinase fhke-related [Anaeramoeba ignava]
MHNPENIMLVNSKDDTSIKICDFGLSRFTSEKEKMSTFVGTLQYLAPEIIVQLYPESIAKGYTKACDLWSCGIILYVLLSGYIPFTSLKQTMIMKQILEGDIDFPPDIFSNVSIAARNLIRRMLTVDPLHRITAEEALQHPWILGQSEKIKDEMQDVWTKKPKLFK